MTATRWHLLWRALLAVGLTLLFSVYVETQAQRRADLPRGEILAAAKAGGGWMEDITQRQAAVDRQVATLSEEQKNAPVAERLRLLRAIAALEPQRAALRAEAEQARVAEAKILAEWHWRNDRVALVYFPAIICFVSCLGLLLLTQSPAVRLERDEDRRSFAWLRSRHWYWLELLLGQVPVLMVLLVLTGFTLMAQYGSVWPELEPATIFVNGTATALLAWVTGAMLAVVYYQRWQWLASGLFLALAGLLATDQMLGWHPANSGLVGVELLFVLMAVVLPYEKLFRRRRG